MASYDPLFARYYDYLVHDRREALATEEDLAFLRDAFARHGRIREILDAGCGAGRYLVPLAQAGYALTGLDMSPEMLAQCAARLRQRGLTAHLIEGDLLQQQFTAQFDAVLCMNSVLCYFLETETLLRALAVLYAALRPGGLLVLEIWHILAKTATFGTAHCHEIHDGDVHIVSRETNSFAPFPAIYRARLEVQVTDAGAEHAFTQEEALRVMTVGEVVAYLQAAGFRDITVTPRADTLEPDSGDEELVFWATKPG